MDPQDFFAAHNGCVPAKKTKVVTKKEALGTIDTNTTLRHRPDYLFLILPNTFVRYFQIFLFLQYVL